MYNRTSNTNKEQNSKQLNLESELKFMIDKCRSIENEKKRLETENENLVFKVILTIIMICFLCVDSKLKNFFILIFLQKKPVK